MSASEHVCCGNEAAVLVDLCAEMWPRPEMTAGCILRNLACHHKEDTKERRKRKSQEMCDTVSSAAPYPSSLYAFPSSSSTGKSVQGSSTAPA